MGRKDSTRKKLNVTQAVMAIILKISRSQWALYEAGLRELSTWAFIRLGQIEHFLLAEELSDSKHNPRFEKHEGKKNAFIENALIDNSIKQRLCERKIEEMKSNYEAGLKFHRLNDFLSEPKEERFALHPSVLALLKQEAESTLDKNGSHELLRLELEQHLLRQEELFLKQRLNESNVPKT